MTWTMTMLRMIQAMGPGATVLLLGLSMLGTSCKRSEKYVLIVEVLNEQGQPIPGVTVQLSDGPMMRTDIRGRIRRTVLSFDGTREPLRIEPPAGYELAEPLPRFVELHRDVDPLTKRTRTVPIVVPIHLRLSTRTYAVVVQTNAAGVPVMVDGIERAVTNRFGVALFLQTGAPGGMLAVRLHTGSRFPLLRPQSPRLMVRLGRSPDVVLVNQQFTAIQASPSTMP